MKYIYEWKQLTSEGRLIDLEPRKNYGNYDVYCHGAENKDDAEMNLAMWLVDTDSKDDFPQNLMLVEICVGF